MSNDESNQWEERMSRSRNIPYYFNRSTGETVWERPEGFFSQVHAYHLLVKHDASRRPSSWREAHITRSVDDARALLTDYREQIVQDANPFEKFKELALQFSDCSSAHKQGDLGWFGRGQMQPSFEQAAFSISPNTISDIVSSDSGLHIIYVSSRK